MASVGDLAQSTQSVMHAPRVWPVVGYYTPKVIVLTILLAAAVIPPFFFLLFSSLHLSNPDGSYGAFTFQHFSDIFTDRNFSKLLSNSVIYSLGSAILALTIGSAQAWIAERTNAPFRSVLYLAAIVSLGVPYVLYIVGWLLFLGKTGTMNMMLQAIFGGSSPYINVYSIGGMIFIEAMIWSPLAFLLLSSVFRNSDAAYEEAAIMCGAGLWTTLRRVTFGMAAPAMLALGVLVFIRAAESFEVPALVGIPGSARVITSTIYQRLNLDIPPNIGSACAFGVILLVVMIFLLRFYNAVAAQSHRYSTVTGKGFRPRIVDLGVWRIPVGLMVIFIPLLVVILPMLNIVWAAVLPYYQPVSVQALSKLTMANFIQAFESPSFRESIVNSLLLGAITATAVATFAGLAGWCVARRISGSAAIDHLAAVPLVFPAIVLGLAYLEIFVHSGSYLYGSLLSLIVVSAVAYIPYGMRYGQIGIIQIHPELEEAANIAGAGYRLTFFRVVLPLLVPALISCWLFVFLLAVRAISMVLLLVGPDSQVVAVVLFDLWNNGQIGELAALGCLWTSIMTVVSVSFYVLVRRYQLPIG